MAPTLTVEPFGAALGAEVLGVDLRSLDDANTAALRQALLDHQVVAVRDQFLDDDAHVALAHALGEPWIHPMDRLMGVTEAAPSELRVQHDHQLRTDTWHLDVTYSPTPPAFGILRAIAVPPYGGDTMWANLNLAYDTLDPELRARLSGRTTVHDVPDILIELRGESYPDRDHDVWRRELKDVHQPMLRIHPETGRVGIFAIGDPPVDGLSADESRSLTDAVTAHATNLNHTCRWRWRDGDVVIWDERCTAHYAVRDPWPGDRVLRRLLVEGDAAVMAQP